MHPSPRFKWHSRQVAADDTTNAPTEGEMKPEDSSPTCCGFASASCSVAVCLCIYKPTVMMVQPKSGRSQGNCRVTTKARKRQRRTGAKWRSCVTCMSTMTVPLTAQKQPRTGLPTRTVAVADLYLAAELTPRKPCTHRKNLCGDCRWLKALDQPRFSTVWRMSINSSSVAGLPIPSCRRRIADW